jgi:uncharacterized protein (TIGR00730 family)
MAKRGHVCVNGAGSFGCMAAMNDGAVEGNGHIVGVIHEMWLTEPEGNDTCNKNIPSQFAGTNGAPVRDGGAHAAFASNNLSQVVKNGPVREILVAGGKNLQERKRLLMEGADALLVLPGGPGTWDELWEAACARGIGLTAIPIVVVNVDGFYDPFLAMMERAYKEEMIKLEPHQLIHYEDNAEDAIRWIEAALEHDDPHAHGLRSRDARSAMRKASFMTAPAWEDGESGMVGTCRKSISRLRRSFSESGPTAEGFRAWILFTLGVAAGAVGYGLVRSSSKLLSKN